MGRMKDVTPSQLLELLDYDPIKGVFIWRTRPVYLCKDESYQTRFNTRCAGKPALVQNHGNGYLSGRVFNRNIFAHRAAFAISHGRWPVAIDHINGDRSDNRLCNLREAPQKENAKNIKLPARNKSGVIGVRERGRGWTAYINSGGKRTYLGTHGSVEEAALVRRAAEAAMGFHPNHGRRA